EDSVVQGRELLGTPVLDREGAFVRLEERQVAPEYPHGEPASGGEVVELGGASELDLHDSIVVYRKRPGEKLAGTCRVPSSAISASARPAKTPSASPESVKPHATSSAGIPGTAPTSGRPSCENPSITAK